MKSLFAFLALVLTTLQGGAFAAPMTVSPISFGQSDFAIVPNLMGGNTVLFSGFVTSSDVAAFIGAGIEFSVDAPTLPSLFPSDPALLTGARFDLLPSVGPGAFLQSFNLQDVQIGPTAGTFSLTFADAVGSEAALFPFGFVLTLIVDGSFPGSLDNTSIGALPGPDRIIPIPGAAILFVSAATVFLRRRRG